ncbi:MAG: hypothetical protein D3916_08015, partial [Candidatus Electrothrix sp. MAN1_4]|nr:hypothetical protein [Candidatus Electrothrix sp. MAN1_4]
FPDCSRFYALYQEAISGEAVGDLKQFIEKLPKAEKQEKPAAPPETGGTASENVSEKARRGGRRGNNPAFCNDKHGVFGLRRG